MASAARHRFRPGASYTNAAWRCGFPPQHLDKLILQFETTAPEFYRDYQNSRTPPAAAATHTTEEPKPTPPTPTPPAA